MCSKRMFSNSKVELDYASYNKIKNGCEILKTIKQTDNNSIINKFKNYNTWQTLNVAYFKYINNNNINIEYLTDIYSAKSCFCDLKDDPSSCQKYTLYPYGKCLNKNETVPNYLTNIYLCKWCNNFKKNIEFYPINNCKKPNEANNCKKCNKNLKPLFI